MPEMHLNQPGLYSPKHEKRTQKFKETIINFKFGIMLEYQSAKVFLLKDILLIDLKTFL